MEQAPFLISIVTSYYFCLPVFNKIFKILFAKILFQKDNKLMSECTKHTPKSEIYHIIMELQVEVYKELRIHKFLEFSGCRLAYIASKISCQVHGFNSRHTGRIDLVK